MRNNKISNDIRRIDEAIHKNQQVEIEELYEELIQTYKGEIKDLNSSLLAIKSMEDIFHNINAGPYNQIPVRKYPENIVKNLKIIKGKLELISNPHPHTDSKGITVNVKNENINTVDNKLDININITFENVREQIRSMDSILDEKSINEILSKINDLEKVIESSEKKSAKWNKVKDIGKWLFDKSVDVGISLLPLFLKIGQ